ncbi:Signal transduction histidine kinase [Ohtaekwangia koreensis]|uniref:histidine kinase n=2 Tax=Ohtaekwangia koreensis TaxID=688867 RepID=A0A1T5MN31_9BACT|nr:Signal transduction histidine kinase [Ohtaekwangia koreensis]
MHIRLSILFTFFIAFTCSKGLAQQLFVQQYPVDSYKGSSQNWSMWQDPQGILYIANTDGLLMYDGEEWKLVTLPNNAFVLSVAGDAQGKIYIGLLGDFGYMQRDANGQFQYHSLLSLLSEKEQADLGEVRDVKVKGATVFFNDYKHSYVYEKSKIKVFNEANSGFIVLPEFLCVMNAKGIFSYKNGEFQKIEFNFPSHDIRWMSSYDDDEYVLVDSKLKFWRINKKFSTTSKARPFSETIDRYLEHAKLIKVTMLSERRIAILTDTEIVIVGSHGEILFKVTNEMLHGNLWIRLLFEDAQHNLWFSTDESIGMIAMSAPLSYFDKMNGVSGIVVALGECGRHQYVGTDRGLFYRDDKDTFLRVPLIYDGVGNLYNYNEKLYAVAESGIYEVTGKESKRILEQPAAQTLCIVNERKDHFIMGTYSSGIWLLKKNLTGWSEHKIVGFEEEVRFMERDGDRNLWIAHYGKGIWKLTLNEAMDSVVGKKFYSIDHGLPSNLNNRIYKLSDQSIVATTENGIYSYQPVHDAFEPDQRFAKVMDGKLVHELTTNINGDLYFRGRDHKHNEEDIVGKLSKKQDGTYSLLTAPFRKVTWSDTEPTMLATEYGVWISDHNKIFVYDSSAKTEYGKSLQPYLKKVLAQDSLIYSYGQKTTDINLAYRNNSIHFYFNLPYFENEERVKFRYKLDGFNTEWSDWTNLHEARFTNLPEGDYVFILQAKTVYATESRFVTFSFHIDPPIYRTIWAYMLYVIAFGFTVYLLTLLNTRRVNHQKKLLEKEVNEKTRELLAMNEEIRAQNEEILDINEDIHRKNIEIECQAQILLQSNVTKDKLFSIISHDLRGPVNQLREIFTMIDSGYISTDEFQRVLMPDLKERIGYVASLTDNLLQWARDQMEGIQVKPSAFELGEIVEENINLFSLQAKKKDIRLAVIGNVKYTVYADIEMLRLVLRNLLSNAIKFTLANGEVTVSAETDPAFVYVSVTDKGTGLTEEDISKIFDKVYFTKYGTAGEKGSGLGLMLCREFIEKNGGKLTIESTVGSGSIFSFSIPLRNP